MTEQSEASTAHLGFSHAPLLRLAGRWIDDAARRLEGVAQRSTERPERWAALRQGLEDARFFMEKPEEGPASERTDLTVLLHQHLRGEDFRPAEVLGAYWLLTPTGESPILSMPSGEITELTYRSKAHILVGLTACSSDRPSDMGFLYLGRPEAFRRFADAEVSEDTFLDSRNIRMVDVWGLRVLLTALRRANEVHEAVEASSARSLLA